jgi:hypothetical protein
MVSPCFFYLLVCSLFFSILGNLLRGILFICCNQSLPYSCILTKTGVVFSSLQSVCLVYNLSKCILLFFSAAVILSVSVALMVQFSIPYNKTGRTSVLYNFILVFFKVFCVLT